MKIEFDGSQKSLKKIVALLENRQNLEIFCPNCAAPTLLVIHEQGKHPSLECSSCARIWKIESSEKSRRERVWDKFTSQEKPNN